MENMDKGLTVPKWVLIVWREIPQMPQNLCAQLVCPSPQVLDFNEKRLHWASVVRAFRYSKENPWNNLVFRTRVALNNGILIKENSLHVLTDTLWDRPFLNSNFDSFYSFIFIILWYVQCGPSMTSWVNPSCYGYGSTQDVIDGPHCINKKWTFVCK